VKGDSHVFLGTGTSTRQEVKTGQHVVNQIRSPANAEQNDHRHQHFHHLQTIIDSPNWSDSFSRYILAFRAILSKKSPFHSVLTGGRFYGYSYCQFLLVKFKNVIDIASSRYAMPRIFFSKKKQSMRIYPLKANCFRWSIFRSFEWKVGSNTQINFVCLLLLGIQDLNWFPNSLLTHRVV